MPDFDAFERLIRNSMTVTEGDVTELVDKLAAVPRVNRPKLFKDRSRREMEDWVMKARQVLADRYGPKAHFITSNLNREGSDLTVVSTGEEVELKTGKVTDANIGIKAMAWAMGDKDKSELYEIMSKSMIERRSMALAGDFELVRSSQEQTMSRLYEYFNQRLTVGNPAPTQLRLYAVAVARGFTKQNEVTALLGHPESRWASRTIFHAHWSKGWVQKANQFHSEEQILVDRVFLKESNGENKIRRAQVRLKGSSSGRTALFYPHYKNAYQSKGEKVLAKYWVNTACFHIWIDKIGVPLDG